MVTLSTQAWRLFSNIPMRPKYHGTHVDVRKWRNKRDAWPVVMAPDSRDFSTISNAAIGMWKKWLFVKLSRQLKIVM